MFAATGRRHLRGRVSGVCRCEGGLARQPRGSLPHEQRLAPHCLLLLNSLPFWRLWLGIVAEDGRSKFAMTGQGLSTPHERDAIKRSRGLAGYGSDIGETPELGVFQIVGGRFAAILDDVKRDFLPFDKLVHAGPLNCGNVDEHVLRSIAWLDEAEATLDTEELNGTDSHEGLL